MNANCHAPRLLARPPRPPAPLLSPPPAPTPDFCPAPACCRLPLQVVQEQRQVGLPALPVALVTAGEAALHGCCYVENFRGEACNK